MTQYRSFISACTRTYGEIIEKFSKLKHNRETEKVSYKAIHAYAYTRTRECAHWCTCVYVFTLDLPYILKFHKLYKY